MNTSHGERQPIVVTQNPPEVPRRPRSTQNANSIPIVSSNSHSTAAGQPHPPQPAVREIHKNAWLKRIAPGEKKGTPFVKKYEKLWVVFCVHDDVEAFLEFYSEPKMGATHRPNAYVSLNSCLHVSPSIIGQENNEYQFAVTLSTQVIRLVAANWDQMIEWVESLQGKLREMNILSPKDNLYSKLPETRGSNNYHPGYISTRDPNSPLPPTPNGYSSPVLGTETSTLYLPVSSAAVSLNSNSDAGQAGSLSSNGSTRAGNSNLNVTNNAPITLLNEQYVLGGTASIYVQPSSRDGSGSDSGNGSGGSIMSISEPRVTIFPISVLSCPSSGSSRIADLHELEDELERPNTPSPSVSVVTGNHNSTVVQVGSDENECFNGSSNVSHSSENQSNANNNSCPSQSQPPSAGPSHAKPIPQYSKVNKKGKGVVSIAEKSISAAPPSAVVPKVKAHPEILERQLSAPSSRPTSSSSENVYEHLFVPEPITYTNANSNSIKSSQQRHSNGNEINVDLLGNSDVPPAIPRRDMHRKITSSSQRSSSLNRLEEQNGTRNAASSSSSSRRNQNGIQNNPPEVVSRSRQKSNNKELLNQRQLNGRLNQVSSGIAHLQSLEGNPMEALIGVRSGEYRIRREETVGPQLLEIESDIRAEATQRNPVNPSGNLMSHVPLKEQQVIRLRAEINHPGGVRVVLRKKDCVNSIGMVDYLGAVWVGGWKQQQHPVLYYAFHVGDQILKVAGVSVQNSVEANRAIKMASSLQVEFIIRRVPHGSVFVLKRSREGEPLGLVAINNTPELGEVLRDGLAASQGLPPSCRGTDGTTNCTWFLTEVNNRPLSLMARENEVRDRLNAVGKEISILVQPSDLVKHLKKQVKSMKGFKDYLVV